MTVKVDLFKLYESGFEGNPNTTPNIENIPNEKIDLLELYRSPSLLSKPKGGTGDIQDYGKYVGEIYDPYDPRLESRRASAQSTGSKILGTAIRTAGELVGGTIEATGHFLDVGQTLGALDDETQEWGNWITDIGKSIKEGAEEIVPLYTDPSTQGKFMPWDADWWYTNIPSFASTLSLMIPGAGVVRGASMLAKALNISNTIGKTTKFAMKGIGQAVASRLMENGMEATGTYEEQYQRLIDSGIDEETAKRLASQAASDTWVANWAMLAQDIPQYLLLNRLMPKATMGSTRGTLKALGKDSREIIKQGMSDSGKILLDMLGEAGEEGYQFIVSEEAKNLADIRAGLKGESEFGDRVRTYLSDGEFWTSATIGALGAGIMQTAGKHINAAIARVNGTPTQEDNRISNIANWGAERKYWGDRIKDAESVGDYTAASLSRDGMITSMGVQSAQNGNLGSLRDTFEIFTQEGDIDENTLKLLNATKEDIPEIKKNAQAYISKLNRIEELFNGYSKNLDTRLAGEIVREEMNLESLLNAEKTLSNNVNDLQSKVEQFGSLSRAGKDSMGLKSTITELQKGINILENRLNKGKDELTEERRKSIEKVRDSYKKVLEDKRKELKELKYSKEDKEADAKVHISEVDFNNWKEANSDLYRIREDIDVTQLNLNKFKDKKYQKKVEEALNRKDINTIKDAIKYAESFAEVKDIVSKIEKETPKRIIKEEVANETFVPNYDTKGVSPSVGNIYRTESGDINRGVMALDMLELSNLIDNVTYELGINEDPELKSVVNILKEAKSEEDINKFFLEVYREDKKDSLNYKTLKQIVSDYFNQKSKIKRDIFADQEKNTQEIKEFNESEETEEFDVTEFVTIRSPFDATLLQYEMEARVVGGTKKNPLIKYFVKYDSKGNPIPAKQLSKRIDWGFINSKKTLHPGTEVTFEVDLSSEWNPFNSTVESFQIDIVSSGIVVGVLPDYNKADPKYENTKDLLTLRQEIWDIVHKSKKTTGIVPTNLVTTVSYKHAGRIGRQKGTYHDPLVISKRTATPLTLGIGVVREGKQEHTDLRTNRKGFAEKNISESFTPTVGAVYMFIPAANGNLIPIRLFTKKIKELKEKEQSDIKNKIYKQILSIKDRGSNLGKISQKIKEDVYLNFKVDKDNIDIFKNKVPFRFSFTKLKERDANELKRFEELLEDLVLQVDVNKINTIKDGKPYNELIANRLKTNIRLSEPINSSRITLDTKWKRKNSEVPVEPIKKPDTTPVFVEDYNTPHPQDIEGIITMDMILPSSDLDLPELEDSPFSLEELIDASTGIPILEKDISKKVEEIESKNKIVNLDDIFDSNDAKGDTLFRKVPEGFVEEYNKEDDKINLEKELEWYKTNFPNVPIEIVKGLIDISEYGGGKAWGLFKQGLVVISDVAKPGTVYHEAFHVVFNMYLTNSERNVILGEYKDKYNLTDLQIEEDLADRFIEYKKYKATNKLGLSDKIISFFKRLYDLIKWKVFNKPSIDLLFHRIDTGYYKNKKFARDISNIKNSIRFSMAELPLTPSEVQDRSNNIADAIRRVVDKAFSKYTGISRADFVQQMFNATKIVETDSGTEVLNGIDIILKEAWKGLFRHSRDNRAKLSDYAQTQYYYMLTEFIKLNGSKLPEGKVSLGRLGDYALRKFAITEGITFKTKGGSFSGIDRNYDESDVEIKEDEIKLEGWQITNTEVSRRDSATSEIRKELSYIEKVGGRRNALLLPEYINASQAFATIIKSVSDKYTRSEMINSLKELSESIPEYTSIYDKVVSNEDFASKFFIAFQNTHAPHYVMIRTKKNGKVAYRWIHANKLGAKSVIDTWKDDFYNPDKNKLIDSKGNLITDAKIVEEYYGLDKTNLGHLKSFLNKVGITINEDELKALNSVKSKNRRFKSELDNFLDKINSILVNYYFKQVDPFEEGAATTTLLNSAASVLSRVRVESQESAHRSIDNKTIYTHILSFFMSKQIQNLKNEEYRSNYLNSPFYKNLPWLKEMTPVEGAEATSEFYEEEFGYALFGGKRWEDESIGTTYTETTSKDLEIVKFKAFNLTKNTAWYQAPILGDAPSNIFIKNKVIDSEEEIVDKLYQTALCEWGRIKQVKEDVNKDLPIVKNFNDSKTNNASKFHFIPELNNHIELFERNNEEEIKKVITDWVQKRGTETINDFVSLGIIKRNSDGELVNVELDNIPNLKEEILKYSANYLYATTQMIALFQGDPAFYNGSSDFFKRAKEVWSPGILLDMESVYRENGEIIRRVSKNVPTVFIEDDTQYSIKLAEEVKNALLDLGHSESVAYSIAAKLGYYNHTNKEGVKFARFKDAEGNFESYKTSETNITDGQGFITLDRYAEIQVGLSRWGRTKEEALNNLKEGRESDTIFQPIKPFYFSHRFVKNLVIPTQIKNSEFVLLPTLAYNTEQGFKLPTIEDKNNGYKSYKSPLLAKLLDFMQRDSYNDDRVVSAVQYNSTVKAGLFGSTSVENIDKAEIHYINNSDYRLQQETPDHYIDDTGLIGVQNRKLIISDISNSAKFELGDRKDVSKKELLDKYQQIVSNDIIEAFNDIEKKFETIESVQKILLEEVRKRDMGTDMEEALSIVTRIVDGKAIKRFKIPLFDPIQSKRVESLLGSILKNRVIKQKMPGGNAVQVSGVGFKSNLKVVIEDNRVKYVEAMLPFWMRTKYSSLINENNELDISKLEKYGIDKIIGYRIPTEDKYSMIPIKVVGFLPQNSGGAIMLPPEITTLTGSDFDIDKIYLMMPTFREYYENESIKEVNIRLKKFHSDAVKSGFASEVFLDVHYDIKRILDDLEKGVELDGKDEYVYRLYLQGVDKGIFKDVSKKFERVKFDYNKPASEQSRAARDNAKLDIYWSVLTNPDTLDKIMNPGGFDELSNIVDDVNNILENKEELELITLRTARTVFNRFMAGKALIGIFANHNVNHAIVQHANVTFANPIMLNNRIAVKLDDIKNEDDKYISRELAQFLAAVVDNAKNPISSYININMFTADIASLLLRAGFSMKTTVGFLNQPYIRRLSNRFNLSDGSEESYRGILADLTSELRKKGAKTIGDTKSITSDILFSYIKESDTNEFLSTQLTMLEMFDRLRKDSFTLGTIVQVFRPDNTGRQIVLSNNEIYKNEVESLDTQTTFNGVGSIWDSFKMIDTFYEYSVNKTDEVLNKFFIWNSPSMKFIKKELFLNLGERKRMSQKILDNINYELLGYLSSEYYRNIAKDKDYDTEREFILKEFPSVFTKFVERNPELNGHDLIKRLTVKVPDKYNELPHQIITFSNTGSLKPEDIVTIRNSWRSLLDIPKYREFAQNLIKYTFYTHGFHVMPTSFSHLIPLDRYITEEGDTFSDFLYNLKDSLDNEVITDNSFFHQFMRNNWQNEFFVPSIDKSRIQNVGQEIVLHKKAFSELKTKSDFARYITLKDNKGNKTLYVLSDSSEFVLVYNQIEPLGFKNISKEYLFNSNITSIYSSNRIKPTTTTKTTTSRQKQEGLPTFSMKLKDGKFYSADLINNDLLKRLGYSKTERQSILNKICNS